MKNNRAHQTIAVTLSVALALTSIPQNAGALPVSAGLKIPDFVRQLTPPPALGTTTDYFNANAEHGIRNSEEGKLPSALRTPNSALVILIQDLHGNYGVQKNIAQLLEFLAEELPKIRSSEFRVPSYEPNKVVEFNSKHETRNSELPPLPPFSIAVEGAAGPVDTSALALFPDKTIKTSAMDYLMREGELQGTEYFAAMHGWPALLTGVEEGRFYNTNRELFRQTFKNRKQLIEILRGTQAELLALRPTVYSKTLQAFQEKLEAFNKGEVGTPEFVAWLSAVAAPLGMDVSSMRATTPEELDRLLENIQAASFIIETQLARTDLERDLVQVDHDLALLLKVADLQATEPEVRAFGPRLNQFITLTNALLKSHGLSELNETQVHELISTAIDYYILALMRNKPMVENTLALLGQRGSEQHQQPSLRGQHPRFVTGEAGRGNLAVKHKHQIATSAFPKEVSGEPPRNDNRSVATSSRVVVLVAGGFHTLPITKLLKERDISYLVLSPAVDEITPADHELYVKRLNGEHLTAEEVLVHANAQAPESIAMASSSSADNGLAIGFNKFTAITALALVAGYAKLHGVPVNPASFSMFQHAFSNWASSPHIVTVLGVAGAALVALKALRNPRLRRAAAQPIGNEKMAVNLRVIAFILGALVLTVFLATVLPHLFGSVAYAAQSLAPQAAQAAPAAASVPVQQVVGAATNAAVQTLPIDVLHGNTLSRILQGLHVAGKLDPSAHLYGKTGTVQEAAKALGILGRKLIVKGHVLRGADVLYAGEQLKLTIQNGHIIAGEVAAKHAGTIAKHVAGVAAKHASAHAAAAATHAAATATPAVTHAAVTATGVAATATHTAAQAAATATHAAVTATPTASHAAAAATATATRAAAGATATATHAVGGGTVAHSFMDRVLALIQQHPYLSALVLVLVVFDIYGYVRRRNRRLTRAAREGVAAPPAGSAAEPLDDATQREIEELYTSDAPASGSETTGGGAIARSFSQSDIGTVLRRAIPVEGQEQQDIGIFRVLAEGLKVDLIGNENSTDIRSRLLTALETREDLQPLRGIKLTATLNGVPLEYGDLWTYIHRVIYGSSSPRLKFSEEGNPRNPENVRAIRGTDNYFLGYAGRAASYLIDAFYDGELSSHRIQAQLHELFEGVTPRGESEEEATAIHKAIIEQLQSIFFSRQEIQEMGFAIRAYIDKRVQEQTAPGASAAPGEEVPLAAERTLEEWAIQSVEETVSERLRGAFAFTDGEKAAMVQYMQAEKPNINEAIQSVGDSLLSREFQKCLVLGRVLYRKPDKVWSADYKNQILAQMYALDERKDREFDPPRTGLRQRFANFFRSRPPAPELGAEEVTPLPAGGKRSSIYEVLQAAQRAREASVAAARIEEPAASEATPVHGALVIPTDKTMGKPISLAPLDGQDAPSRVQHGYTMVDEGTASGRYKIRLNLVPGVSRDFRIEGSGADDFINAIESGQVRPNEAAFVAGGVSYPVDVQIDPADKRLLRVRVDRVAAPEGESHSGNSEFLWKFVTLRWGSGLRALVAAFKNWRSTPENQRPLDENVSAQAALWAAQMLHVPASKIKIIPAPAGRFVQPASYTYDARTGEYSIMANPYVSPGAFVEETSHEVGHLLFHKSSTNNATYQKLARIPLIGGFLAGRFEEESVTRSAKKATTEMAKKVASDLPGYEQALQAGRRPATLHDFTGMLLTLLHRHGKVTDKDLARLARTRRDVIGAAA